MSFKSNFECFTLLREGDFYKLLSFNKNNYGQSEKIKIKNENKKKKNILKNEKSKKENKIKNEKECMNKNVKS